MERPEAAALIGILLVAVLFVASDPGGYAFQMDPAEFAERGRAIAAGRSLPLAGANVASGEAGRWTGPLAYYLSAIPFFFSSSIDFAVLFFGALVVAAAALLWSSARLLFGPPVGLAAAALFAASAQVALEHRLLFFSSLAPLFVLALLRACVAWGPRGHPRAVLAVVVLTGALIQLHIVHLAFVAMVPVTWWTWRPRIDRTMVALGCAVVVAFQLPWVVEQILTDGRDVERFVGWIGSRDRGGTAFDARAAVRVLGAAVSAPFRIPLDVLEEQGETPSPIFAVGFGALALLTVAGVVLAPQKRRWRPGLRLVAAWTVPPLALFVLGRNGVYSFHLLSVLPAFALLAALGAARLTAPLGRRRAFVLAPLVAALMLVQGALLARVAARVEAQGYVRFPMSMILSYPDELWRFPVDVEFPTLRDIDRIERLLAARGLPLDVRGRVHGPHAMAYSHYPPVLPAVSGGPDDVPDTAGPHFRLARGEGCAGAPDAARSGPWCLLEAPDPDLLDGWRVQTEPTGEEARPTGFPADASHRQRWSRALPAGADFELRVWTVGPAAVRMDAPTPPGLEVRLDGAALEPLETRASAPFWVLGARRYRVRTDAPARLEIRALDEARAVIDLWPRRSAE